MAFPLFLCGVAGRGMCWAKFGLRRQIKRGGREGFASGSAGAAAGALRYGLRSPIRRGSDCARALPRAGGGRCGVWGLGKPIRPRFALASTGGGCGYRSQLKEMPPEDSGGMAGWALLEERLYGLAPFSLGNSTEFPLEEEEAT